MGIRPLREGIPISQEYGTNPGGYTPPLPDPTWRITQAVEQYLTDQKEASG